MEIQTKDSLCIAMADKNIDSNNADDIGAKLLQLIDGGATCVLLDFSRTEYISSIGLGVLITVHKKLRKANGVLALVSLGPKIYHIFEETKFTTIFPIFASREDALKELSASKTG